MKSFKWLLLSLLCISSVSAMESDVLKDPIVPSECDGDDYLAARQNDADADQDEEDIFSLQAPQEAPVHQIPAGVNEDAEGAGEIGESYEDHICGYDSDGADDMYCAFRDAVRQDDIEEIEKLLPAMATNNMIDSPNSQSQTPLHFASSKCSTPTVEKLLQNNANTDSADADGRTALHYASTGDLVKVLLQAKADAKKKDAQGRIALHHMAERGNVEALEALLSQSNGSINVNEQDDRGMTPLHYAAHGKMNKKNKKDKLGAIKVLVNHEADASIADNQGRRPIHLAVQSGDADRVGMLASRAPKTIESVDSEGRQPIHYAAERGLSAVVKALVKAGASPDVADCQGYTPLHYGIMIGNAGLVRCLIEDLQARIDIACDRMMPFHKAIEVGNLGIVQTFCSQPININASYVIGDKKWTPLTRAADYNHRAIVCELLEQADADPNSRDGDGNTALHLTSDLEIALLLRDHGANVDLANANQQTPLFCAAASGNTEIMQVLLNNRAQINWVDAVGKNALHYAAQGNKPETVKLLLLGKAEANACDGRGNTPLHLTTDPRIADLLLQCKNTNINALNYDKQTPLFFAAASNNVEIVHFLIDHGARFDLIDIHGRTPLHYAATQEIAETFMRVGVNITVRDHDGKTALERAREKKRFRVANALLMAEAAQQRGARQQITPPEQEVMPQTMVPVIPSARRPSQHRRTASVSAANLIPIQEEPGQQPVVETNPSASATPLHQSTESTGSTSPAFLAVLQNLQNLQSTLTFTKI